MSGATFASRHQLSRSSRPAVDGLFAIVLFSCASCITRTLYFVIRALFYFSLRSVLCAPACFVSSIPLSTVALLCSCRLHRWQVLLDTLPDYHAEDEQPSYVMAIECRPIVVALANLMPSFHAWPYVNWPQLMLPSL